MFIICDGSDHASPPPPPPHELGLAPQELPLAPQELVPAFLGSGRAALQSTPWASSSLWMASDVSKSLERFAWTHSSSLASVAASYVGAVGALPAHEPPPAPAPHAPAFLGSG